MTHTPTFCFSITQFAVKNWSGVSGFTPRTLFTRIAVYAILSCLATFSKPTDQTQLSAFMSWPMYLIAHTPKNCRLEFICQDFQSPKLIQFRTPSQNAPSLPLVCVKFGRFQNPRFSICFVAEAPHTVSKSHVHPLQHVLPAVTGRTR
jgi:hypothetical protein